MTKVLVLGACGMLGSMIVRVLGPRPELEVSATTRGNSPGGPDGTPYRSFDVLRDSIGPLLDRDRCSWIVNAIGVTKPRINELVPASVEAAVAVNALFPHRLAAESAARGQRVIQIATDGVFSGTHGPYDESAPHDPPDVYGKTKSLGEVAAENVVHLRCSIIGPEHPPPSSLLGWALSSRAGSELDGYIDQRWNGITTLHFAQLCAAVIGGLEISSPQHVVPFDHVSKADLLELALAAYGREDLRIRRVRGPQPIDRRLTTHDPRANARLWSGAGYERPPTVAEMLRDLAALELDAAGTAS